MLRAVDIIWYRRGSLGLLAGHLGGWVDLLISRVFDIVLSFPVLILYIILCLYTGTVYEFSD